MPNIAQAYPGSATLIMLVMAVLAWVIQVDLTAIGEPLATGPSRYDIVDFELASPDQAINILGEWSVTPLDGSGDPVIGRARDSLLRDFAFIPTYSTVFALATLFAAWGLALAGWASISRLGTRLGWAQWLAGLFDVVENLALLRVLEYHAKTGVIPSAPQWTAVLAASLKFGLLLAALVFVGFGSLLYLRSRLISRKSTAN